MFAARPQRAFAARTGREAAARSFSSQPSLCPGCGSGIVAQLLRAGEGSVCLSLAAQGLEGEGFASPGRGETGIEVDSPISSALGCKTFPE